MEIYVEGEFVNRCNDCPFYNIETEVEFVGYEKNYHKCLVGGDIITGNCPLKPLSARLSEERKKVVQEIKTLLKEYVDIDVDIDYKDCAYQTITDYGLKKILDQIERGEII